MTTIFLSQGTAQAADVTLAWDASDGAAGYKIYYGTTSNSYTDVVDVGDVLTHTFTNLPDDVTYYFAATAYDETYLESDFSEEVSYDAEIQEKEIFWRNSSTGNITVWYMNNASRVSYAKLTAVTDTNWQIMGTADFNSDGKTDILWHNTFTGASTIWYMDGATRTSYAFLPVVTDTNWQIVGTK
jgi:hypothetical protein